MNTAPVACAVFETRFVYIKYGLFFNQKKKSNQIKSDNHIKVLSQCKGHCPSLTHTGPCFSNLTFL